MVKRPPGCVLTYRIDSSLSNLRSTLLPQHRIRVACPKGRYLDRYFLRRTHHITSRRPNRIVWRVVSSVRRRHPAVRRHERRRLCFGSRQPLAMLGRRQVVVSSQRSPAECRQVGGYHSRHFAPA